MRALMLFLFITAAQTMATEPESNPHSRPMGMIIATSAVGATGATALIAGIISSNQPYDGGGADIGGGVAILAGAGMLTSSLVMGVITYVKYKKWKGWEEKNRIAFGISNDGIAPLYKVTFNWNIP